MILSLLIGTLSLVAITGLGRLLIRPLGVLPLTCSIPLAFLSGMALKSASVQLLAMAGSGRAGFLGLEAVAFVLGIAGHLFCRGRSYALPKLPGAFGFCLLGLVIVVLVFIGGAPSSKIDELHYHMLTGRRVLEDSGLRVYQLPVEQAIVPQMGYQIAETVFHAMEMPDAGNILSLGFALCLWFLIYRVAAEETGRAEMGLFAAVAAAIGLYPAVWYVTAGPHALGDLGTFTAMSAVVFPQAFEGGQNQGSGRNPHLGRLLACFLGSACAASTKLSLVPLGLIISALALYRVRGTARLRMGALATGVWALVLGPLIIWTYVHTGSPFGAALAQWFGRTVYQPAVFQALARVHRTDDPPLGVALYYAVEFLNGASLVLILLGAAAVCRQKRLRPLAFLVALQLALIAGFLFYDFRFLGGLQYGLLVAGMLTLSSLWPARHSLRWLLAASLPLLGPWLAAELYYAVPFAGVSLHATTRESFLRRFVALSDDFHALAALLPMDATLYVPNNRAPALYAPRPVIFSRADWNHRTQLYRLLLVKASGAPVVDASGLEPQAGLKCGDVIYRNPAAVVVAFRTMNREPERSAIVVQRCVDDQGAGAPASPGQYGVH